LELVIEFNPMFLNSFSSFDLFMLLMDYKSSYNLVFLFLQIIAIIKWVVYYLIILNNSKSLVILFKSLISFALITFAIIVFISQEKLLHFAIAMIY